jgi:hypothetical protein
MTLAVLMRPFPVGWSEQARPDSDESSGPRPLCTRESASKPGSRIAVLSDSAKADSQGGGHMRSIASADAKNNFGELIDLARAAPVMVTQYNRSHRRAGF